MIIYIAYKVGFKGKDISRMKYYLIPSGILGIFSYIYSVLFYEFTISLLFLLFVSVLLAWISMNKKLKFMSFLWMEFIILPIFVISFLMLGVPAVAQVNYEITCTIDQYKYGIYNSLPEDVAEGLNEMTEPKFSTLEELQAAINKSLNDTFTSMFGS
jgi:hypothetical protein